MTRTISTIKKVMIFGLVFCAAALYMGCDDPLGTNEDELSITITGIDTIDAGQSQTIEGEVDGDPAPTSLSYSILQNGTEVTDQSVRVTGGQPTGDDKKFDLSDLNVTITTTESACSGTYTLKITGTAGNAETSKTVNFEVNGVDCSEVTLTEKQVTLGSFLNTTYGSSLDVDSMEVYSLSNAKSNAAKMDVWFSNLADGGKRLWSMKQAAEESYYDSTGWAVLTAQKMHKVSGVTWSDITTQSDVDALWSASSAVDTYVDITAGDIIIVESTENVYRLLRIVSAEGTNDGTAVIIGLK